MDPQPSQQQSKHILSSTKQIQQNNKQFYIVKNIENCQVTVPTNQTQYKYYQITIPEGPAIRIYFINHSMIRVRVSFDLKRSFVQESYSLVMTAWDDRFDEMFQGIRRKVKPLISVNFKEMDVEGQGKYYYFQTNQLIGKIFKNPYGMEIYNKSGNLLYKDLRGRSYKRDLQGRIYHYCQIDEKNDCFYGFGQNTGKLNKFGQRMRLAPQDSLGYNAQNSSPLYKHIPFYMKINRKTKHALGFFYNNSYQTVFDMGSQRSGYWPRYSYYCADGGDIDLFIINGPTMKKVIQKYTDLTGKTAMAPLQSLGYIGSTMYYAQLQQNCDGAILDFIKKCKRQNVPISNFHLSSGYTLSQNKLTPKRYVFTWNKKKFSNPPQFFANMKQLGVFVSPNVKPGLLTTHHLYQQFASNSAFIKNPKNPSLPYTDRWWGGQGSFVDFTNKKSRQIWKKHLLEDLISKGTNSIWNDNNQYQSIDNRSAICSFDYNSNQLSGQKCGNVDKLKSVQSLLMAHVAEQAVKQNYPGTRPYIVTRSGCAGMQRYASSWSGDNYTSWKTLKANISTILNMGLSGVANYGADIGGFWGPAPTAQLFLRWVQHGVFQPRFSIHSCNSDNTVTQPWMFPQYAGLIAKTIRFRYVLLPYLYSLLYFSNIKGRPIMRPLVYQFQDTDFQNCTQQSNQFMFGPYMLVANVLDPINNLSQQPSNKKQISDFTQFPHIDNSIINVLKLSQHFHPKLHRYNPYTKNYQYGYKQVYLPKGCNWYSWNGRQKYQGGSRIQIKVGVQSIPIFVKDKSVIPLAIKFGKSKNQVAFDMTQMNKQHVTGLYVKIVYDGQTTQPQRVTYQKSKNNLDFIMYSDDGISQISQQTLKNQSTIGPFQRSQRLNPQISPNSSFLLTKFTLRYLQTKQPKSQNITYNPNMLLIDINRQGNLFDQNIYEIDLMILQIKSIDASPIWITINDMKCKMVLNQQQWMKWRSSSVQKLSQSKIQGQNLIIEQAGCWYYNHEKGATILKLHKKLTHPVIQKYRNLTIKVCKDKMIQFQKQYKNIPTQIEDNSQMQQKQKQKNKEIRQNQNYQQQQIVEQIQGQQIKRVVVKQRRRIIGKDRQYTK